jgi:hypothetical protein
MSYNGSGTFQINSSGQPVVTGTVISSTAFNALTADLATGLSTAITKDGQTTTTARILFAQGISSTLVTDATSATTGSIITAGGISCQKQAIVGTNLGVGSAPLSPVANRADVTINGASAGAILTLGNAGTRVAYLTTDGTNVSLGNETATGYMRFLTNSTEAARFDASGRLLLNTTATISVDRNEAAFSGSTTNGFGFNDTTATAGCNILVFRSNGTAIGTISNNSNTGVLYNVTSDKELKDFVGVHDNGDILDRVEWNDFTWKSHPDNGVKVGAFAQDIYKIVPDVVTPGRGTAGEEDFIPWQVDYTGLVPYLGAEVKSLRARVATLEARLTALEPK